MLCYLLAQLQGFMPFFDANRASKSNPQWAKKKFKNIFLQKNSCHENLINSHFSRTKITFLQFENHENFNFLFFSHGAGGLFALQKKLRTLIRQKLVGGRLCQNTRSKSATN